MSTLFVVVQLVNLHRPVGGVMSWLNNQSAVGNLKYIVYIVYYIVYQVGENTCVRCRGGRQGWRWLLAAVAQGSSPSSAAEDTPPACCVMRPTEPETEPPHRHSSSPISHTNTASFTPLKPCAHLKQNRIKVCWCDLQCHQHNLLLQPIMSRGLVVSPVMCGTRQWKSSAYDLPFYCRAFAEAVR